jgi:hypothetical protein
MKMMRSSEQQADISECGNDSRRSGALAALLMRAERRRRPRVSPMTPMLRVSR